MPSRRDFLLRGAVLAASSAGLARVLEAAAAPIAVTVYKSPTCGCCHKWVDHLKTFPALRVTARDNDDMDSIKAQLGVPGALQSCHTAVAGRYVFEGHVPGDLMLKLLREQPKGIAGLAVPGMPAGSPGMEMGARKDRYDVVAFGRDGRTSVYAKR